jgi:hypothetical protein
MGAGIQYANESPAGIVVFFSFEWSNPRCQLNKP